MEGTLASRQRKISTAVLHNLLKRIACTDAVNEPFGHIFLEDVFPVEIYEQLLTLFPDPEMYERAAERHYGNGQPIRAFYKLSKDLLARLSVDQQALWGGIAAALTAPELKQAMFAKLSDDLVFRYGVPATQTAQLAGHSRPTLYRETQGFEIPPHPDTRKKVVTMHLYLPADPSQLDLGTALYRRKLLAWPFGTWRQRFEKVKQFPFQPNSGYAFVVNNKFTRKSWHGREELPPGAGVRNTLLNTFYDTPREEYSNYGEAA